VQIDNYLGEGSFDGGTTNVVAGLALCQTYATLMSPARRPVYFIPDVLSKVQNQQGGIKNDLNVYAQLLSR
jgi:hypothetical protein